MIASHGRPVFTPPETSMLCNAMQSHWLVFTHHKSDLQLWILFRIEYSTDRSSENTLACKEQTLINILYNKTRYPIFMPYIKRSNPVYRELKSICINNIFSFCWRPKYVFCLCTYTEVCASCKKEKSAHQKDATSFTFCSRLKQSQTLFSLFFFLFCSLRCEISHQDIKKTPTQSPDTEPEHQPMLSWSTPGPSRNMLTEWGTHSHRDVKSCGRRLAQMITLKSPPSLKSGIQMCLVRVYLIISPITYKCGMVVAIPALCHQHSASAQYRRTFALKENDLLHYFTLM